MKTQIRNRALLLLMALFFALGVGSLSAGTLYDNGPVDGHTNNWDINHGNRVSDSFVLNEPLSNLQSVTFYSWMTLEVSVITVDWSIGSSPFGNDLGHGTAGVTDTLLFIGDHGVVHEDTFSLPSIDAKAGTYWLTLENAQACGPFGCDSWVGWDQNSGLSQAFSNNTSNPISSEAFSVGGSAPEPGSLVLFGSGILGLGGVLRKHLRVG